MPLNIINGDDFFEQGIKLHFAGRNREAEQYYLAALKARSDHAGALYNLGIICVGSGRLDQAIEYLLRANKANPTSSEVYNGLGEAYRAKYEGDTALKYFAKAIELNPKNASAYNNRGIVLAIMGRIVEAADSWQQAIAAADQSGDQRDLSLVYNNIGNAHLEYAEVQGAIENHRRACALAPANSIFFSNLLRDYNHAGARDSIPMDQLVDLHREWWRRYTAGIQPLPLHNSRDPERKIRIGFISPDLREHSVMYFLTGLFVNFDRSRFEFFCYSSSAKQDTYTQWAEGKVNGWRQILGMRDEDAARLIQADGIDILIDLAGHTSGNRLEIFAYNPAPVQVTYLGYPMTTGALAIDWKITDALADPPGVTDGQYTERLWRLERPGWCYRCPVEMDADARPPISRGDGAPFTFGSFNNYSKVSSEIVELWSRILREMPEARLFLKSMALRDEGICEKVRAKFEAQGIESKRLLFSGKQQTTREHLQRYAEVDLALDTFPYEGTTTTCEAMWMNVPVVTIAGATHESRVGVSLLTAVGMEELIAKDEDAYVSIALGLANDVERLTRLRSGLRERMKNSALRDEVGFTRAFEAALRGMWRAYCAK